MAAADISAQIRAIQQASRGEEVRDSIVTALNAINDGAKGQSDIDNAINALDVNAVGGNGKYIKSISESNGKISAVEETADTQPTANSQKLITSGGVKSAIDSAVETLQENFQDGVDAVYDAVVAKGSTPASKSLSDVVAGIGAIETGIEPTGTKQITQNGISDVTNYASVDVQVPTSGGITPVIEIFLNGGDGDTLVLTRNKDVSGLIIPEEAQAFSQYAYHEKTTYSGYRNSDTPAVTSLTLTESILLESEETFKNRFPEMTSMEYNGNIYGNASLIIDLNLQLLCDASAGGNSTVTLSDSIENYSLIFLQGIYQTQKSSNYNTTKVYINPSLNTQYWAGMKDRNSSYDCFVTFTSNTEAALTGNKQVMIYGIPKSSPVTPIVWNKVNLSLSRLATADLTDPIDNNRSFKEVSFYYDGESVPNIYGRSIWKDVVSGNIYYSNGSTNWIFQRSSSTWMDSPMQDENYDSFYPRGNCVWNDGENTYHSYNGNNHRLGTDFMENTVWLNVTFTGLTNFNGEDVWTDGTNIYYSNGSNHYILNKSTLEWTQKTWNGLTSFNGSNVWTDGEHIYYSDWNNQYVLDINTSTWTQKTWNGISSFLGENVWTDGNDIYMTYQELMETPSYKVLDKSTSTWNDVTWSLPSMMQDPDYGIFSGHNLWTDGDNIYASGERYHFKLTEITTTQQEI